MSLPKRLRYEIFRRDNHTCRYCGSAAPDVKLTVDHVVPVALGGADEPTNLVTACAACNSGKTSSSPDAPLVADVAQDALRWARAMERATKVQARQRMDVQAFADSLHEEWSAAFVGVLGIAHEPELGWGWAKDKSRTYEWVVYDYGLADPQVVHMADTEDEVTEWVQDRRRDDVPPMPEDWESSIPAWITAGLTMMDVEDAASVAARAKQVHWQNRYRYFCGVLWRMVEDRQEIARQLIEAEDA